MRKIFLMAAIILVVALAGGILYWYFVLSQQPASDIAPGTTTKPTPGVGFGSLRPYAGLCKEFQKVDYKISCEKAVEIALEQAPGKVQKVSIEPVRASAFSSSNTIGAQTVEVWMIDIQLTSPYFDRTFQKEIQAIRIGIRLDDPNGFYKKPLE